ncbi:putative sugar ABC transporter [Paenibacillus algicola]|uniref:Putative sugar ABC transporter n=1 Tax=Paenibacillus algicola TaxID=2565926 RepID=A0A4V1G3K5_9BACL|nr:extracellular solute-binding protein [Paenibacillus algicola]QCT01514.1 putative sugar ABC transporter [Paenibacillus algicola]
MKRIFHVILVLSVFLVAACGNNTPSNSESSSNSNNKTENQGEEKEKIELLFWTPEAGAKKEAIQSSVDTFNASQNEIVVKAEHMDGESLKTKMKVSMASNQMPDIFHYWSGDSFKLFVDANVVADLTDHINKDESFKNSLMPGALDRSSYDGKVYGLPNAINNVILWYNKDIFAQYNLQPPTTMEELEAVVKVLKENDVTPISLAGKRRWPVLHWFSYLSNRIGGNEPFQKAIAGEGDFTQESFIQAGAKLQELVQNGSFTNGFLGVDNEAAEAEFTSGKSGMYLMGDWSLGNLKKNSNFEVGYTIFPVIDGGAGEPNHVHGGFGTGYAVSNTADLDAAYKFLAFLLGTEERTKFIETMGEPSPVKTNPSEDKLDPVSYSYLKFAGSTPTGYFPFYDQALGPKKAELLLNAVSAIAGDPSLDVKAELSKVK